MDVNGVRSSCETVATNSSFSRPSSFERRRSSRSVRRPFCWSANCHASSATRMPVAMKAPDEPSSRLGGGASSGAFGCSGLRGDEACQCGGAWINGTFVESHCCSDVSGVQELEFRDPRPERRRGIPRASPSWGRPRVAPVRGRTTRPAGASEGRELEAARSRPDLLAPATQAYVDR